VLSFAFNRSYLSIKQRLKALLFQSNSSRIHQTIWLSLSLAISLYFGGVSLHYAFSQPHIVQDDVRIHIVWFQRFVDPQLFPNDLFARYYQAIQPIGFKGLYWAVAQLGIEPLWFAKILPLCLSLLTTSYVFGVSLQFLPIPSSAFLSTLILNQNIWLKDDLISATPRSFNYLLLAAFLYYVLNRSLFSCLVTLAIQGVFYPQLMLVEIGILGLRCLCWQGRSIKLVNDRSTWIAALTGCAIGVTVILLFSTGVTQEFGDLVSAADMQTMPEFNSNGRRAYFGVDPLRFWLAGASGLRLPLFPPIIWVSLGLPFLLKARSPLTRSIAHLDLLGQLALASLGLFALAHLVFPTLYLPSRYTFYSARLIMAIGAGLVLFVLIKKGYIWLQATQRNAQKLTIQQQIVVGLCGLFAVAVFVIPAIPSLFLDCQNWVMGTAPELYQFLRNQPPTTVVASLTPEANNIPVFTGRSVLVSQELAMPYHARFYQQVQQRLSDLIRAQYSSNLAETQTMLNKYQVDFLLVDNRFFEPSYLLKQDWLIHSSVQPVVRQAVTQLQQGATPAIVPTIDRCTAIQERNLILLEIRCIQTLAAANQAGEVTPVETTIESTK
jgi:hypothetical protein